jgi:hypothetical protein
VLTFTTTAAVVVVVWSCGTLSAQPVPTEPAPAQPATAPATATTAPTTKAAAPHQRAALAAFGATGVASVTRQPVLPTPATPPFRLTPALDLPDWFELKGEQRTRYEYLDDQFRRGFDGSDQGIFLRTALRATVRPGIPQFTVELLDSRQYLADEGSSLTTGEVNAVEPVQLFAALNFADAVEPGDKLFMQGGRFVLDIGSRRFVARNDFRNTTNTFTGFNGIWTGKDGSQVQGFWTMPIDRLPSDPQSLLDNDPQWDEESIHTQFWGIVGTVPHAIGDIDLQGFFFGLDEDDAGGRATRDREIYTIGGRIGPRITPGHFDFEVEAAYQFGHDHASTSSTADLDHSAYFVHAEIGRAFTGDTRPRVALLFDYASGDENPTDGDDNRFDTLFGARRFDFGPTGIFGPFPRNNLISPGYRITFVPAKRWDVMLTHRFYWLAEATDAWTSANLSDPTGDSGNYLGTMPEVRVRYEAIPGNLLVDVGAAYLFKGGFATDAPNAPDEGDSLYVYFQTVVTF